MLEVPWSLTDMVPPGWARHRSACTGVDHNPLITLVARFPPVLANWDNLHFTIIKPQYNPINRTRCMNDARETTFKWENEVSNYHGHHAFKEQRAIIQSLSTGPQRSQNEFSHAQMEHELPQGNDRTCHLWLRRDVVPVVNHRQP